MKFLRTVRFDSSDDHVFEAAARPDEWAVSGAFAFAGLSPDAVTGKRRQAFANGFLGLATFGRSTFACVATIAPAALETVEQSLAAHLVAHYGAPDVESALPAAREEAAFVQDLVGAALVNTVFTVRRQFDKEGRIREEFRTVQAPTDRPLHARIWKVVDEDG